MYLAGVRHGLNAEDLWKNNRTGIEALRQTMNLQRFRFLIRHIRLDDHVSREERLTLDELVPTRTFIEKFNEKCKKNYSNLE